MGASNSTRPRRASSDVTQGRRRAQLRSASGTFLKSDSNFLTPWYPTTPVQSRSSSPRSTRSSFGRISENLQGIDCTNQEEGRQQRANSRSFLGRLIRRKRTCTSSSYGSNSTIEGTDVTSSDVTQGRTTLKIQETGNEPSTFTINVEQVLNDTDHSEQDATKDDDDVDDVFLDFDPKPKLATVGSSCSEEEAPSPRHYKLTKKHRSETLVYKPAVAEKAVQTDELENSQFWRGNMTCDHCRRRCPCYVCDSYDLNSSTQSLKFSTDEMSKQRRKRWSPLMRKRHPPKQAMHNVQRGQGFGFCDRAYQWNQVHPPSCGSFTQMLDNSQPHSQAPTPPQTSREHASYRPNGRYRRTFSEDKPDEINLRSSCQCVYTSSDPSLCTQRSFPQEDTRFPDHPRRARLYALCLQKANMPLVKSSSYSPTPPLRRQTWSEKSRPVPPPAEGPKKNKGLLHILRNLRSSCSETDIVMRHRPSVDSLGYVDPLYLTRNLSRMNTRRLSLSHPNLTSGSKGNTTPPGGLRERVSAAVGRLEKALSGRTSINRSYSLESQSTSNGGNSDLPGSPTDSDAAYYTYNKGHLGHDTEHGYMVFDPDLNPPIPRQRRFLSSSCSSVPSSPGFQEGFNASFDEVPCVTSHDEEGIYESLDNYSPRRRASTVKSLNSSDGEAPPEVPPRPPSHRIRYKGRMLRRQMPLPPIPTGYGTSTLENSSSPVASLSSVPNENTGRYHPEINGGASSSCKSLPYLQRYSSEEDSVFEAHPENVQPDSSVNDDLYTELRDRDNIDPNYSDTITDRDNLENVSEMNLSTTFSEELPKVLGTITL